MISKKKDWSQREASLSEYTRHKTLHKILLVVNLGAIIIFIVINVLTEGLVSMRDKSLLDTRH